MTPSNPDNQQPLIYRICDALGVFHLVAPVNHTHSQSEIEGLQTALLSKADASSTDAKINGKISRVPTATNGNIAEFDDDGNIKDSGKKTSDFADASTTAAALSGKQDTLVFDSTPTEGSTNPVTSDGVKAADDSIVALIPIWQVINILPKTSGHSTEWEKAMWITSDITSSTKYALELKSSRSVGLGIYAKGWSSAPDGGYVGDTDITVYFSAGERKVINFYDLLLAQLQSDYPGQHIDIVSDIKLLINSRDTVPADTISVFNVYTPGANE